MKKLSLLLVAALPILSYGQKIEVGLNGGIGLNSVPGGNDGVTGIKRNPSFVVSAKALVNFGDTWQAGIGADMQKISVDANGGTFRFGNPGVPVYFLVNKKIGSFYSGIIGGMMFPNTKYTEEMINTVLVPFPVEYNGKPGYTVGLHVGYVLYLTNKLGVNGELGGRYANISHRAEPLSRSHIEDFFYYQATVGLRYSLF